MACLIYDCPNCGEEINSGFQTNIECPNCHKRYETDWDYSDDNLACWITKEIND